MKRTAILLSMLLMACETSAVDRDVHYQVLCDEAEREHAAQWAMVCVEKANPMSDEEPEDWIHQCRVAAQKLLCSRKRGFWRDHSFVLCSEEPEACELLMFEEGP